MKRIDLENRLELFRGAVTPGVRMNQELAEFYTQPEAWMVRAQCASSVRILFYTDAEEIIWQCKFGALAREVYTTDIFVDEKMTTLDGEGPHTLKLAPGRKKLEIYMPHLVVLKEYSLYLNDSAYVEAIEEKRPKLLICGDSIMQGMTCSSPARASVCIAARALDMDLHNTSVGGVIMRSATVRDTLLIGGDVVVVALGINDISHKTPMDVFCSETEKTLQYLSNYNGKCFIITPIPTTREDLEAERGNICQAIRDVHAKYPAVTLVEGESFFPADDALLADKLHPNDKGMEVYARGLIDMIGNK